MEELKNKLAALGLSGEQLDSVIGAVLGFIKDKLPGNVYSLIEGHLTGNAEEGTSNQNAATPDGSGVQTGPHDPKSDLSGLLGTVSGLLGK